MDSDAAVALGDRNQVAYFRHLASTAAGGVTEEDDRYLFFAGAHDYPGTYINGAIRKSTAIAPAEFLARADAFFGALGRQYVIWVRAHADADLDAEARRRGLWARPPASGNECILRVEPLESGPAPDGFVLARVDADEDLHAYLAIVARNYGFEGANEKLVEAVLFSVDSLRSPDVAVFLAREAAGQQQVRAGISVFVAHGCAGLQWTVTDPVARGQGLAPALIRLATAWGFDRGATCGWGMSSQQGSHVWRKIGFDVPTRYLRYVASAHLSRSMPGSTRTGSQG